MKTVKIKIIQQLGYNIDKDNCSRCIKAGYYKMGLGNCLYHPDDGFTAPCVIEFELEEIPDDEYRELTDNSNNM